VNAFPAWGDGGNTPPSDLYADARWYACYTRARHERQVAGMLEQRQVESYLPTLPQVRQWKDRKKTVEFPLFPSYVFGRFSLSDAHRVLTIPGISTIVRVNGYPTPIADEDLDNIRRFVEAVAETGMEVKPGPYFAEGERVRVREGPFAGVVGTVVELRGRGRILVGIEAIGQGLEINIDARLLEPHGARGIR
jgi:transcription antitermination factor NusG